MLFYQKKYLLIIFYLVLSFFLTISFVGIENIYFNEVDWLLGSGDKSNAQNGWTFFKNDQWHFPLGKNPNYGLDISTSIIFSDSIPLFAFIFKIFKNFLGVSFQYFSLWILLCFFLQLYLSYLIIFKCTKNTFFSIFSSFIFLIAPILIYRISFHISLGGQWLILLGFYLNLLNFNKRKNFYWILLLILSTLIHLYFTIMLFGIYFVPLLQKFMEDRKILNTIFKVFTAVFVVLFFMFIFGYFETPVMSTVSRGYGELKLDLLSIFDPTVDEGTTSTNWSIFLKNIPGTSIEGFNYFGLGNIFLFLTSIIIIIYKNLKEKSFFKKLLTKNIGYFFILLFFTFWSLTTNLSFGGNEILNIPLHNYMFGALSIFAATGRFFWPVYYILIIFSLILIYKNLKIKHSILVIILAFFIQVIDTYPALEHHFIKRSHFTKPIKLNDNIWSEIPKKFEKFRTTYLFNNYGPLFKSLSHFLGTSNIKQTDIVLVAGMDRSKAAEARYNFNDKLYNNKFSKDTAYVIDNLGHLKLMKKLLKDTNNGFFYRDNFWLFLPNKKSDMSKNDIELFSRIKFDELKLNQKYNFTFSNRDDLLGVGWSHNNYGEGVWSEGNMSFILFGLEEINNDVLNIKLKFKPYESNKKDNFIMKIFFNNILKEDVNLSSLKNENELSLNIEKNELEKENIIMFKFENLISPLEIFESPDARKLGILLKSILLES